MPELPEVETIVKDLNKALLHKSFIDIWTDNINSNKLKAFQEQIIKIPIKEVIRKGKNIFIIFSNNKVMWIHLKLTGHLLLGKYQQQGNKWWPLTGGAYLDRQNLFIHWVFTLNDQTQLVLSDSRRFARVELMDISNLQRFDTNLGPDPLSKEFTQEYLKNTLKRTKSDVKKYLMNQKYISGIGNIYANEILFEAKINPFRGANSLTDKEITSLFSAIKKILTKAIKYRGTSAEDEAYRDLYGQKGSFGKFLQVYQHEGERCPRCKAKIERKKDNNRSTFYCPVCQK